MRWPWQRPPASPAVAAYLAGTRRRVPRATPVAGLSFVVLDTETTGFDPARDRVLSIAALPVRAGRMLVAEAQAWLVFHPHAPLNPAIHVHGILPDDTAQGEPEATVLAALLPLLTGAVLVGHHIGFDIAMLDAAFTRHFHLKLRNPVLDTARLAGFAHEAFRPSAYPGQRPPSLDEVCALCEVPLLDRHTAEGDAFTTAELFLVLCARLQVARRRPLLADDLPLGPG